MNSKVLQEMERVDMGGNDPDRSIGVKFDEVPSDPRLFQKVSRKDGVDGHFHFGHSRVLIEEKDIPQEFRPLYAPLPGEKADERFWPDFVSAIREISAAKDKAVNVSESPKCFTDAGIMDAASCAANVEKDWATELMRVAAKDAVARYGFRDIPGLEESVFTDKVVLLDKLLGDAAWKVSPNSFAIKWARRKARPEEIVYRLFTGDLEAPDWVMDEVNTIFDKDAVLADIHTVTMYKDGAPGHPPDNGMHAAAGFAEAMVIKVLVAIPADDKIVADKPARDVGNWRIKGGMHTETEDRFGAWLGEWVTMQWLPFFLRKLGVDPGYTMEIMEEMASHGEIG